MGWASMMKQVSEMIGMYVLFIYVYMVIFLFIYLFIYSLHGVPARCWNSVRAIHIYIHILPCALNILVDISQSWAVHLDRLSYEHKWTSLLNEVKLSMNPKLPPAEFTIFTAQTSLRRRPNHRQFEGSLLYKAVVDMNRFEVWVRLHRISGLHATF